MSLSKWAGFVVTAALLSGCQIKPQLEKTQLTKAELKTLFAGKTVESYSLSSGATSFTYYSPDGRARQVRFWEPRDGYWKVTDDNEICLSMEGKDFSCRPVFQEGDRYYKYRMDGDEWVRVIRYRQFIDGDRL
ncbi:MAG: hypothetical protein GYB21_10205 [Oceanospirillales bacterium]|nr:hypothetical protein [Oceanospirillales bacterium]